MPLIKPLVRIGNSYGVIIDRALLKQVGLKPVDVVALEVKGRAIYVRKAKPIRGGKP